MFSALSYNPTTIAPPINLNKQKSSTATAPTFGMAKSKSTIGKELTDNLWEMACDNMEEQDRDHLLQSVYGEFLRLLNLNLSKNALELSKEQKTPVSFKLIFPEIDEKDPTVDHKVAALKGLQVEFRTGDDY